ncbi:MAG: glucuronate isomerase [Verrucomicrobiia bacterium]
MRAFITEDFLLQTPVARELYHEIAAHEPIFDYHGHLPPTGCVRDGHGLIMVASFLYH